MRSFSGEKLLSLNLNWLLCTLSFSSVGNSVHDSRGVERSRIEQRGERQEQSETTAAEPSYFM